MFRYILKNLKTNKYYKHTTSIYMSGEIDSSDISILDLAKKFDTEEEAKSMNKILNYQYKIIKIL